MTDRDLKWFCHWNFPSHGCRSRTPPHNSPMSPERLCGMFLPLHWCTMDVINRWPAYFELAGLNPLTGSNYFLLLLAPFWPTINEGIEYVTTNGVFRSGTKSSTLDGVENPLIHYAPESRSFQPQSNQWQSTNALMSGLPQTRPSNADYKTELPVLRKFYFAIQLLDALHANGFYIPYNLRFFVPPQKSRR